MTVAAISHSLTEIVYWLDAMADGVVDLQLDNRALAKATLSLMTPPNAARCRRCGARRRRRVLFCDVCLRRAQEPRI